MSATQRVVTAPMLPVGFLYTRTVRLTLCAKAALKGQLCLPHFKNLPASILRATFLCVRLVEVGDKVRWLTAARTTRSRGTALRLSRRTPALLQQSSNSLVPAKPKNYDKHASVPFWPPLWRGPERRAETVHLISRRAVTGKALLR